MGCVLVLAAVYEGPPEVGAVAILPISGVESVLDPEELEITDS